MAELHPYQMRVVEERVELKERWAKLGNFMGSPAFASLPMIEQEVLRDQLGAMMAYLRALDMRLSLWGA